TDWDILPTSHSRGAASGALGPRRECQGGPRASAPPGRSRRIGASPGLAARSPWRRTPMQPAADALAARSRPAPAELLQRLGERFGDRYSAGESVRHRHGRDESPYDTTPPDCVVFPENSEEVAEVVRTCARHRVPVIAYGAGTSIEGHIMA